MDKVGPIAVSTTMAIELLLNQIISNRVADGGPCDSKFCDGTCSEYSARKALAILKAEAPALPLRDEQLRAQKFLAAYDGSRFEDTQDYVSKALANLLLTIRKEALEEAAQVCEKQRQKILANPSDPSWTEHLAEAQQAIRALAASEPGRETK